MKKKIFNVFFCLIAALMILNLQPNTVTNIYANASSAKEQAEATYNVDDLKGFRKFIYNVFSGSTSDSMLTYAKDDMTITDNNATIMLTVYKALLPFALGLALICMLIDLIEKASMLGGRGMDEKFYFVALAKLIVAEWLLCQGPELIVLISGLNNAFLRELSSLTFNVVATVKTETVDNYVNLFEACKSLGTLEQWSYILPACVMYIVNLICSFAIRFQTISKKVEFILMGSFAAVAMGGVFAEFSRGTAVRYLKKFMACALHAASILLIIKITDALSAGTIMTYFENGKNGLEVLGDGTAMWLMPALYKFTAIGSISLAKSIINDAFGS